jgi:hypothetical protein
MGLCSHKTIVFIVIFFTVLANNVSLGRDWDQFSVCIVIPSLNLYPLGPDFADHTLNE